MSHLCFAALERIRRHMPFILEILTFTINFLSKTHSDVKLDGLQKRPSIFPTVCGQIGEEAHHE
jgi:hypothetical protein